MTKLMEHNGDEKNIDTPTDVDDSENYSLSPSIVQDQLFDIYGFSPSCALTESETKNIDTPPDVDDSENYSLSPSIVQDQLFDIYGFSPSCALTESETKVVLMGEFLVSPSEVSKHEWSCMFGEVEVPAEAAANGGLFCYTPPHTAGRVRFYVTCSNGFINNISKRALGYSIINDWTT